MRPLRLVCIALLLAVASNPVLSQGKKGRDIASPSQAKERFEAMGQVVVGLVPVYPKDATCPEVASPFGAQTRYDGSARVNDHFGFHNGMDISAVEGTPLIAIAAGEVVHKGSGGPLVGNYVWLRHAPADTGLPVYLYARYQHLDQASKHAVGARLMLGDYVGPAGKTGTQGPAFGPAGYSHLHLLIFAADGPDYTTREAIVAQAPGQRYLDPLAVFMPPSTTFNNHALRALPDGEKRVAIPYQTADGARHPAGTRVVWPLACVRG